MKKLELSIIIVNYNTGTLLGKCLQSIKETTDDFQSPPCGITVVDNASSDESITRLRASFAEVATKAEQGYAGRARIKIIKNSENVGFAKAVNQGTKAAKRKYILLLNPDTEVKSGAVKNLVEFAKSTRDVGVVGAKLLNPDGSPQGSVFPLPTIRNAVQEFWLGRKAYSKYALQGKSPVAVDAVSGAVFLITPQAQEKVGLLDEHYFMYFEDLDYCRRVKNAGLKVYYLPTAQVVHYHGVSGRELGDQKSQWKRLIPSSKIYHGIFRHYLLTLIIWSGQKWQRFLGRN